MHLKVFTKCQMLCNAYDDMSGFSILNTRGVTIGRGEASPQTSGEVEPAPDIGRGRASPRTSGEAEPAPSHRAGRSQPWTIGRGLS